MAELSFNLNDVTVKSTWTNGSTGSVTTTRTGTVTRPLTVDGLPDGAVISAVTLNCVCGRTTAGYTQLLSVNDDSTSNLTESSENAVPLTDFITGNGDYTITFRYRSGGNSGLTPGNHTSGITITEIVVVVEYTGDSPDETPEGDTEVYDYPDSHNICVYAPDDDDFTTNGLGILTPTSCIVREEAGGEYELEMELPAIDDVWQNIEVESIIKAPVPAVIVDQFTMADASYWKVKSTQSGVKVMSKIPSVTRTLDTGGASEWSSATRYTNGARVTYGTPPQVYQYTGAGHATYKEVDGVRQLIVIGNYTKAPGTASYWVNVSSYDVKTNSGKVLATLGRNEVFINMSDSNSASPWIRVKTNSGVTGYIEKKYAELYSQEAVTVEGREIRQQCFRVYRVEKDSDTRMIKVSARHLSYDAANVYLGGCEAKNMSASAAISLIQNATLQDDNRHIYTDIEADDQAGTGTCDLDCSWDNEVSALLNPDSGIVAQLQAKLIRDNEDFFILQDEHTDRNFRIEYGNNLKALNWSIDTTNMVTRVVPHCKDKDDGDLLTEEQWVDSPLINEYSRVYVEPMSVNCKEDSKGTTPDGEEHDKLTKAQCYEIMKAEAEKRFTVDHADEPEITIDVDLVMLGSTVEYQHLAPLEVLFMYDTVHIKHPLLNLDIKAYMTGYEYDAILRRYNRITLTNARRRKDTSVSGFDLRDNSIRFEKLSTTAVDRLRA